MTSANSKLDLDAIKAEWLELCGYCDVGLPMGCTCPSGDYRPVMFSLVAEVERLKALVQAEHDQERKRIVAALRDEGIKNLGYPADAGELLRGTADAIERGEFDDLAAGDE